mmetsp:Transcript_48449/g.128195  ORF Transcript_48449/g.128195 Transcript_48449/m.128195 type:complete len:226 (-) Transcript_48449:7-684(-)
MCRSLAWPPPPQPSRLRRLLTETASVAATKKNPHRPPAAAAAGPAGTERRGRLGRDALLPGAEAAAAGRDAAALPQRGPGLQLLRHQRQRGGGRPGVPRAAHGPGPGLRQQRGRRPLPHLQRGRQRAHVHRRVRRERAGQARVAPALQRGQPSQRGAAQLPAAGGGQDAGGVGRDRGLPAAAGQQRGGPADTLQLAAGAPAALLRRGAGGARGRPDARLGAAGPA